AAVAGRIAIRPYNVASHFFGCWAYSIRPYGMASHLYRVNGRIAIRPYGVATSLISENGRIAIRPYNMASPQPNWHLMAGRFYFN
ncbi:MAG: hypothetical protein ACI4AH_00370, partial [Muribaculaceae bacterium]